MAVGIDFNNPDEGTTRDSNLIIPLKSNPAVGNRAPPPNNAMSNNLGFDAEDADGDAVALELELLNNGGNPDELGPMTNGNPGQSGLNMTSQKFKVRIFLNMDEDDDGKLGISPSELFIRVDESLPFYIDVSTQQRGHYD